MTPQRAQEIGLEALLWLAAQPEPMQHFLAASGAGPNDVRQAADDPAFLGFVLDFLLNGDALVVAFCEDAALPRDAPMRARMALPGGDLPNWT